MGLDALTAAALADAHRRDWARVLAAAVRVTRHLEAAEDAVQEAFAAAAENWPAGGVPADTAAWLMTVAKRKALDARRRDETLTRKLPLLVVPEDDVPEPVSVFPDDRLRLLFTCCHPALSAPARVALTLRLVCGLPAPDIARLFLISPATMAARLTRAKKKIHTAGIPYRVPGGHELPDRLPSVLDVISLLFTEGHTASRGDRLSRTGLVDRARDLARMLVELMPDESEAIGLLATIRLADARGAARLDGDGALVPLEEQDRGGWDAAALAEGRKLAAAAMRRASAAQPGQYALHAAIAAVHSEAPSYEETDWPQIVALYDLMIAARPSPVAELARAAARAMTVGPAAALREVVQLAADPRLAGYHGLPALRADLLRRLGRWNDAAAEYEKAAALTGNDAERAFLRMRASGCRSR